MLHFHPFRGEDHLESGFFKFVFQNEGFEALYES